MPKYNEMSFQEFDQTPGAGIRALLPPPESEVALSSEELRRVAGIIDDYIINHDDLQVPDTKVQSAMFSLHWHAFQLYAQCNDSVKMREHMSQVVNQFDRMSKDEIAELEKLYGPTVKPYVEATLIFLNESPDKQKQLSEKLEEVLRVPLEAYPEGNIRFFPGRICDMKEKPDISYSQLFSLPRKLPPLPGQGEWHVVKPETGDKDAIDNYMRMKLSADEALKLKARPSPQASPSKKVEFEEEDYYDPNEQEEKDRWKKRQIAKPSPFKDPKNPFS